jgi:hypothetical protein
MGITRSGLQPLKESPEIRLFGFAHEPVIHGDVLVFPLDAGSTSLEH